jgi:hypothetical protein
VNATLLEKLRNDLIDRLQKLPGFRSVGLTRSKGQPVFVVSVDPEEDPEEFRGKTPSSFHGYSVEVRNLGRPVSHATWRVQ